MGQPISFIHAADLHLDTTFKGLGHFPDTILDDIKNATFAALDKLTEAAIDRKVDFVLITGDLFDHEHQTLKAQVKLRTSFEKLKEHHIKVFISYGNHDHINGHHHPVRYPENVHIFPDETVRQVFFYKGNEPAAAIYGFSYENRSVAANKTSGFIKSNDSIPYHIAMLHGSLASDEDHEVHAPFSVSDLLAADMDYWALGHIHQRSVLKHEPPIIYPGNIQGRHRKENGEKGCYYVQLTPNETDFSFIPLQSLVFEYMMVDSTDCGDLFQLEQLMHDQLKQRSPRVHELLEVTLAGDGDRLQQWEQSGRLRELIDLLNDTYGGQTRWQYIYRYNLQTRPAYSDLHKGSHFISEVVRQFEEVDIMPMVEELYHHRQARRFLPALDNDTKAEITEQAKQWLMYELLSERGD